MAELSTTYMGLTLKNPVIVGSSSLTNSVENIKKCAEAGAGAVVLKSLFEEQIYAEKVKNASDSLPNNYHTEAMEYIYQTSMNLGPEDYLKLIREAKEAVDIPVIASLNCFTADWWIEYAKRIEKAGASALELNIAHISSNYKISAQEIEDDVVSIAKSVKSVVNIPIAVKIGPYFAAIPHLAKRLSDAGIDAIVIFNRFYQIDTDIETLTHLPGHRLSSPNEITLPLRFVSILSGKIESDIAGTRGVHSGEDVVKMLLAGATAVQVCSVLYDKGLDFISTMVSFLDEWMERKNYSDIHAFRGLLSQKNSKDPDIYERMQYIKILVGIE